MKSFKYARTSGCNLTNKPYNNAATDTFSHSCFQWLILKSYEFLSSSLSHSTPTTLTLALCHVHLYNTWSHFMSAPRAPSRSGICMYKRFNGKMVAFWNTPGIIKPFIPTPHFSSRTVLPSFLFHVFPAMF